ncbi:MAG: hypothetical protein GEV10_04130 [Streptosporangiales bacterium]|nr:hypothetical protein [Streptosporangiales bacterium]
MALSRRVKVTLGATVFAGAAALTTTGAAVAQAEDGPILRITESASEDRGGTTGLADDGDCPQGQGGGGSAAAADGR